MINGKQSLPGSANAGLDIKLRGVEKADLAIFDAHWESILTERTIPIQTILYQGQVAGSILSYVMEGKREVSYWVGKDFWGRGIATQALSRFLEIITER
jgi:RimJ/RimL family protein N-acetyltransferase